MCNEIADSCICDVGVVEGPWGFEAYDYGSDLPSMFDKEFGCGTPEDALFWYSRPRSKQYIVLLSESVAWRCIGKEHISRSRHISLLEAVA